KTRRSAGCSGERKHALLVCYGLIRMKQNSFDPAKHRRVRADSDGKTKNRKKRKSRIAPQHPQTETEILSDLVWPHPPPLLASQLLHLFEAAKFPTRRGACFHRRHTGRNFSV